MTSSLSQQARDLLAKQYREERDMRSPKLTPSRTYTNATTTGLYTGNNMGSGRGAEAEQHKQYTGAGFRAQIRRV